MGKLKVEEMDSKVSLPKATYDDVKLKKMPLKETYKIPDQSKLKNIGAGWGGEPASTFKYGIQVKKKK